MPPPLQHLNLTQVRRQKESPQVQAASSDNYNLRCIILMLYFVHLKYVNVALLNIKLTFYDNAETNMLH